MSRKYYYLVASLPLLQFSAKPPVSSETFLASCREQLTAGDFCLIQDAISLADTQLECNDAVIKAWKAFNHNLRNEIAWLRALKANKNPQGHIRGEKNEDPWIVNVIIKAAEAPDPLSAEHIIDRARWDYLEALAHWHYFDLEILVVYALKLKILQRYQSIDSPRGKELFSQYTKLNLSLN